MAPHTKNTMGEEQRRRGLKHLIECQCVLPQYKNSRSPIYHKFVVFSIIDEDDNVIEKHAQCNNCGVIHKVTELGRSEIVQGKESLGSLPTIEDIRLNLPDKLVGVLESYDLDVSSWEECQFIMDEELWGSSVVLKRDVEGDLQVGKRLIIKSSTRFRIESWQHQYQVDV